VVPTVFLPRIAPACHFSFFRRCGTNSAMELLLPRDEQIPRGERKIEQICRSFDMDCSDLNHEDCWRGARGIMPCCGLEVEFESERGICPFLWLKEHA